MSYRVALERLRAYEPLRLVAVWYQSVYGCCVIGAIVPSSRRHGPKGVERILDDPDCRMEIQALGLTEFEAIALQNRNDSFRGGTDADRYEHMIDWLQAQVAKESAGAR